MNVGFAFQQIAIYLNLNVGSILVITGLILLVTLLLSVRWLGGKIDRIKPVEIRTTSAPISMDTREAEVTQATWEKIQILRGSIAAADPINRPFCIPSFKNMNEEDLREFLDSAGFSRAQREKFVQSANKDEFYADVVFWHRLNDAKLEFNHFYDHFTKYRFFFHKEVADKFSDLVKLFSDAIGDIEYGYRTRDINDNRHGWSMITEGNRKITELTEPILIDVKNILQQNFSVNNNHHTV